MCIFDGLHGKAIVLENLRDFRRVQIAAMKDSLRVDRPALIDFANFDIGLGEGYRGFDHSHGAIRPMNRGRARVLGSCPFEGEKSRDIRRMVIMKVSDEDVGNAAQRNSGLDTSFEGAIPKVDEIRPAIHYHGI
jgi:hypothetical protein